jgi:hypothetical protein
MERKRAGVGYEERIQASWGASRKGQSMLATVINCNPLARHGA